ncbi:MAG: hypothetical protein HQK62_11720 [Desulfamplus sp.]|nr:hypothetical protein [Desulfamplus sp.]
MDKWLEKLRSIPDSVPDIFDFNPPHLQQTEKFKEVLIQKMETCLHGEACLYLNDQNQCKRVNVSVFSLNECPLPKSKWFSVKHGE